MLLANIWLTPIILLGLNKNLRIKQGMGLIVVGPSTNHAEYPFGAHRLQTGGKSDRTWVICKW